LVSPGRRREDIITLRFISRGEKRREEEKKSSAVSIAKKRGVKGEEVKGCERLRDDDPNFCHLGLEFSDGEKSICEREREKHNHHKPSNRAQRKQRTQKGKQRENDRNRIAPCSRWKQKRRQQWQRWKTYL